MTGPAAPVTVAVLGLGEAGSRYAADLAAAGVPVSGYDPAGPRGPLPPGLRLAATAAEAADGADVVLSMNAAAAAEQAARDAAGRLRAGAIYADLNTSSPESKRRVAAVLDGTGVLFADVAVLAPVPRAGLRTPVALAGPGREQLAGFLRPLGVPVADAGPEPGAAAGRKLLRSIFMKGLAAAVIESMDVAARAGLSGWLWEQITAELAAADSALATRLVEGTRQHAPRRLAEMRAAHDYAAELGAVDPLTQAVIERLAALAAAPGQPSLPG